MLPLLVLHMSCFVCMLPHTFACICSAVAALSSLRKLALQDNKFTALAADTFAGLPSLS